MNDATVSWTKSLTGTPTQYAVVWSQNGTALPPVTYPVTAANDASGYTSDFETATGKTTSPGDVLAVTVQAIDTVNNLSSAIVTSTPSSVTVPTAPVAPGSPQNVTLALS